MFSQYFNSSILKSWHLLISPTLAFHLTFLLHHADFGRDTTWRRSSREGWILPRFWCDWSTKGPWAFFIPPRIQWWKLTIFNPKAVKVKEVKPFWRAAPFQPQYEWQWFLMPPYTTATQIGYGTNQMCSKHTLFCFKFVGTHRYMLFLVKFFVALRRWSLTRCEFCHFAFCTVYIFAQSFRLEMVSSDGV